MLPRRMARGAGLLGVDRTGWHRTAPPGPGGEPDDGHGSGGGKEHPECLAIGEAA